MTRLLAFLRRRPAILREIGARAGDGLMLIHPITDWRLSLMLDVAARGLRWAR